MAAKTPRFTKLKERWRGSEDGKKIEADQVIAKRYRIIEKLGEGGMGAVWKALDTKHDDEVVIKMPLFQNDAKILKRFKREAQMMRKHSVESPHILNIEDIGELNGIPWYAMRFLPGGSVGDRALQIGKDGKIQWKEGSFDWLTQIASALDYLHQKGAFHRDVKPENILFSKNGTPYLVDFGIVKTVNETTSMMTEQGKAIGTMAYMPPEVLEGEKFKAQSDQYSLAVTLYEYLTGERPFSGTTFFTLFKSMQKGHRKLKELSPMIPEAASNAVDRALSTDPDSRFKSCKEFCDAFSKGIHGSASKIVEEVIDAEVVETETEVEDETRDLDLQQYRRAVSKKPKGDGSIGGKAIAQGDSIAEAPGKHSSEIPRTIVPKKPVQQDVGHKTKSKAAIFSLAFVALLGMGIFAATNFGVFGNSVAQMEKEQTEFRERAESRAQAKLKEEARKIEEARIESERLEQARLETERKNAARLKEEKRRQKEAEEAKRKEAARKEALAKSKQIADKKRAAEKLAAKRRAALLARADMTNSIGMKFRLIPAGEFLMGSPSDEEHREDEQQHHVEISRDFFLGKFEVTQGQWKSLMGTEPWKNSAAALNQKKLVPAGNDYPATFVSWNDAVSFCQKLSAREGEGVKYRLPSEAEWEYACRGDSQSAYSFGNNKTSLGKHAWFQYNAYDADQKYGHKVGMKSANSFGLHDMHGNVREWCGDFFDRGYYSKSSKRDPAGPNEATAALHAMGALRVNRGGSWHSRPWDCRSAERSANSPDLPSSSLGFRVLRISTK